MIVVALACSGLMLIGVGQGPARADHTFNVTAVSGSAYGYFSSVSLFGGPPSPRGPAPTVTLPPGGSAAPVTATDPTATATYGPATVFSSGPLTVSTQGTPGPGGSVTSSANVQTVNRGGTEVFTAANLASTCTASGAGPTGSTTITNGTLRTSEGNPDVAGDETVVTIPTNPAPNTPYTGTIEAVGDNFRYVFNEQILNAADGTLTVNGAHLYMLGPTAVGEVIIGQSVCRATGATPIPHPEPGGGRVITGTPGRDTLVGTPGNDTITCGDGDDVVHAGAGNDVINCGPGNDVVDAGAGNDRVDGGTGNDRVLGGPGTDRIVGGRGNDVIAAGSGDDTVDGGEGDDTISANEGNDTVTGAGGNDRAFGNEGKDSLAGGGGQDRLAGNGGNDRASGGAGRDILGGGSGNDRLGGGSGADRLSGDSGRDSVAGNSGPDRLFGGPGKDTLRGGAGKDRLRGGPGRDRLIGGPGKDSSRQ